MNKCKKCEAAITPYKSFCSRKCKDDAQTIYTPEVLVFVQDNIGFMNIINIARKIGVTTEGLKRQISTWRRDGKEVGGKRYEHYDKKPIGDRWETKLGTSNSRGQYVKQRTL